MKKIIILGIGALGSALCNNLVADGHNKLNITILDFDRVEKRNLLGTQYYFPDQEGLLKTESLQFSLYKRYQKEVEMIAIKLDHQNIQLLSRFDLIIDTLDNYKSRKLVQEYCLCHNLEVIHMGFNPAFTFSIEFKANYKVPSDITSGMDICEMQGAAAFVASVASLGSLIVEEFVFNNKRLEITGGKFTHSLIK